MDTLAEFRRVVDAEAAALRSLSDGLDGRVQQAVDLLHACRGRVVVIGMGKCAHIGQKIAATLASTGTPAAFVHPAEAIHGDLGFIDGADVALVLSNSGETAEIAALLPSLKRMELGVVALTGRPESTLGNASTVVLDTGVRHEGDPMNMAPMASTPAMLAVGDALSAVLMKKRGFSREDYAALHPGGSLGQKLLCTVKEIMHTGDALPITRSAVPIREAIFEITSKRLGATFVVDDDGALSGILTDGDLRRLMQKEPHPLEAKTASAMTRDPRRITSDVLAVDALRLMEQDSPVTILPVVDDRMRPVGALHIHDLIKAGIA